MGAQIPFFFKHFFKFVSGVPNNVIEIYHLYYIPHTVTAPLPPDSFNALNLQLGNLMCTQALQLPEKLSVLNRPSSTLQ